MDIITEKERRLHNGMPNEIFRATELYFQIMFIGVLNVLTYYFFDNCN
jgi:hypothetical protein